MCPYVHRSAQFPVTKQIDIFHTCTLNPFWALTPPVVDLYKKIKRGGRNLFVHFVCKGLFIFWWQNNYKFYMYICMYARGFPNQPPMFLPPLPPRRVVGVRLHAPKWTYATTRSRRNTSAAGAVNRIAHI